jgi:hypothetical protein
VKAGRGPPEEFGFEGDRAALTAVFIVHISGAFLSARSRGVNVPR